MDDYPGLPRELAEESSRRVFTYPENWRELEPWALEKLSWVR